MDNQVSPIGRIVIILTIGLIIGIIIALILIVIMYYSRTFFFEYCSTEAPYCLMSDYVQDPSTALDWGYSRDTLLTINGSVLTYHPPRANRNCIPQRPPVVAIPYPRYCIFDVDGEDVEFRQSNESKDIYERVDERGIPTGNERVLTRSNCVSVSATNMDVPKRGHVSNRWD